jgi:hypothetical protein
MSLGEIVGHFNELVKSKLGDEVSHTGDMSDEFYYQLCEKLVQATSRAVKVDYLKNLLNVLTCNS